MISLTFTPFDSELQAEPDAPIAGPRYAFRRGTQDRRPGIEAGLGKRTQEDIQNAADRKKKEKQAKRDEGNHTKAIMMAREAEGAKTVAAMLNKRALREAQDVEELNDIPPSEEDLSEDNGRTPTQPHGNLPTKKDPQQSRAHRALSDKDFDYLDQAIGSIADEDNSLYEDGFDVVVEGHLGLEVEGEGATTGRRSSRQSHIGKAGGVAKKPPQVGSTRKLSEAEKKKQHVRSIRGAIDVERDPPPPNALPIKCNKIASASTKTPAKKSKVSDSTDAFNTDYRATLTLLHEDDTAGSSFSSHAQTPVTHKAFPWELPRAGSSTTATFVGHGTSAQPLTDEVIAGFTDHDVSMSRSAVIKYRARLSHKTQGPANLVAQVPDATIEGDEAAPPKKTRAPKTQVSDGASRVLRALPSWVQGSVLTVIVPSLIKHYGARDDPWDLDGPPGTNHFKTVLNAILDAVYPEHDHDVRPGPSPLCGPKVILTISKSRQQVYDWRSNFGKIAIKMVKEHVDAYRRAYSVDGAATWITNALAKGGRATYATPNLEVWVISSLLNNYTTRSFKESRLIVVVDSCVDHQAIPNGHCIPANMMTLQNPAAACGALQTDYHIKLMVYHIQETDGALFKTSYQIGDAVYNVTYPVRALALATVATCKTGTFVAPTKVFSGENVSSDTEKARNGAVAGLCVKHPEHFDTLIKVATEYIPSFNKARAIEAQQAEEDDDAFGAVDPSSSPVYDE
ncbi:hypothetical protein BD309DRAFT_984662 [Dichomitus squalens]|nr:hypothetical protein BD309DRAFT_984662 [Dichomitus squalens]